MKYQDITTNKERATRLLWGLAILILGLALNGWFSPAGAEVTLCGEPISPVNGVYTLRGHLSCSEDPILYIDEDDAEFDLRGFTATGNMENTGILIEADGVKILGGNFRKCETALNINKSDRCEINSFKAFDSSDKAIRIRGDGNSIVKSLCQNAGNDCFELRGDGPVGNFAESCEAIKAGTPEEQAQGIQFRGPGYAYRCSAIGSSDEGFQIQEGVGNVTIDHCLAINNVLGGIVIEAGASENAIKHNIAFANGDGVMYFDLADGNDECGDNIWMGNKFKSSNQPCIE
jgi:hypothetical protein